jgi:hypothetical protein
MDSATEPTVQQSAGGDFPPAGLIWGIKRSFISYISRLPDGAVTAQEGAGIVDGSFFRFEPDGGSFDPSTESGVLKFRGQVRLSGHYGMLSLFIADPWMEFTEGSGVLSIVDVDGWPNRSSRIPLLALPSTQPVSDGSGLVLSETRALLSPEGAGIFNDQYQAGTEMDPVSMDLPVPAQR